MGWVKVGTEGEKIAASNLVALQDDVPPGMTVRADGEQLFRVLGNLVRNARHAIEATGKEGRIKVTGEESEDSWCIQVCDTGPGLPPKAKENLFTAFEGGVRKGGTGLGLVIASELIRGHGGALELVRSDETAHITNYELRIIYAPPHSFKY